MRRLSIILTLGFGLLSLSFGFPSQKQKPGSKSVPQATAKSACEGWSYYGGTGPTHWPTMFPRCGGSHQSPVNIVNSTPRDSPSIGFDYQPSKLTVNRVEYAAHVYYDSGSSITYSGQTYNLVKFHFHLPGEHKISGRGHVMEMHMVHESPDGTRTAVIGVFFDAGGADNPWYKPIVDNLPPPGSDHGGTGPDINAINLLPGRHLTPVNPKYYNYEGSLTTPCCDQGVKWFVLAEPVRISNDQWEKFKYSQSNKRNDRPVRRTIRAD